MKQSIQLKLGQSLTMTPQLQQAIRLLQLSSLDLQQEIQQALEENPLLELIEEGEEEAAPATETPEAVEASAEQAGEGTDIMEDETADLASGSDEIPDDLPVDTDWDAIYEPATVAGTGPTEDELRDPYERQSGGSESLRDHLLWQIRLMPLSDTDQHIALALIDAIDEDGYLTESIEALHADLGPSLEVEPDEIEAVLHLVQKLDPVGCGARDLAECLGLQLDQLAPETPGLELARSIVAEHLELLGNHDYRRLMRQLRVDEAALHQAVELIRSLDPRPGARISSETPEYVVPDVFVRKREGRWVVELNPDIAPRLGINRLYAGLIRRGEQSADNTYLRNNLQEARWFIKSLHSRNETLLRVATAIVEHQRAFLEQGEEAMKPLILRQIAEQLDMHESTISRITTQKYMHTPRGVYEFKYFFSSHVSTADGGACSATAIQAMIRKLVAEEDPKKPLSDSRIAAMLEERGIKVARRTIAKYREALRIPPSNERKRLG
ncbi:MAG: RNA polymerase factor sigma-54 [Gammaproteobacteria bacterium]|nr:MAG: RNA polymerase factor sigma-54 [Gammaproteobacteria bacterium]